MPITRIGSFFLARCAALCAGLALLLAGAPSAFPQSASGQSSFETFAAQALAAREAGRADEAIRNYRAAVRLRPSWDEGWWYLGTLLYDSDHFDEAIPALRRVVALQPKAGPAWAFLGLSEFETGDYRDALASLRAAKGIGFAEDPDVEKVTLYHLGLLLTMNGEFDAATELLTTAFGPSHFTEQIKVALGLAFLRVPLLPAQVDLSRDALLHAAGEIAVLLANHETDAASRNFENMLRDYPDTPYVHYQFGRLLATLSRNPQAETEFRAEIRITPRSAVVYESLSRSLLAQNKRAESEATSKKAQELSQQGGTDSQQVARYALNGGGRNATASGNSGTTAANTPGLSFEEVSRTAESELRAGHLEQASAAYQNAVTLRASWPEGWRQLGTIAYMRGKYPEAITALRQAVALDTKQPDTWTLLGLSEFETQDYKNSLIHLERGRSMGFSGNAEAVRISRYHLALLLNQNGEFDRAIDLLIPEIGANRPSEEIQFAMGISVLRIPVLPAQVQPDQLALVRQAGEAAGFLSESRYDKAFPILEKLLREYPETKFLHYAYGDALASTSLYDEAQVQLRAETRLSPESVFPYMRLAAVALQLHQPNEAVEDAKKAVALAPESFEPHYWLGRSLLEAGEIPTAIRELELARRYAPNSPKVHFNLARAYSKADRAEDAQRERAEFERLNALLPGQSKSYGDRVARGVGQENRPDR